MPSDLHAGRDGRSRWVVLDTNVLVPTALHDSLLRVAEAGLYEVRRGATTLEELERTLAQSHLGRAP